MAGFRVQIELGFSPFVCKWGLSGLLVLACAPEIGSENVTLSTYYPAPSGVYAQMLTTGNAYLARDGGSVGIGTTGAANKLDVKGGVAVGNYAGIDAGPSNGLIVSGSVGIGTKSPGAALDVVGSVKIADGSQGVGKVLTSDANGLASWKASTGGGSFGGLFYTAGSASGSCASANPVTSDCSCPTGFSDSSYYVYQAGGVNCGWTAGYTATVPCYGQYMYIHQCWK